METLLRVACFFQNRNGREHFLDLFEESDFSGESDLYSDDEDVDFDHVT